MLVSSKGFFDIHPTIECRFNLNRVSDRIITYSQIHHTDQYSQHSSVIRLVWLNVLVFVYKRSSCGFESRCCHLNFKYHTCFEQRVRWHSGNYRVFYYYFLTCFLISSNFFIFLFFQLTFIYLFFFFNYSGHKPSYRRSSTVNSSFCSTSRAVFW